MSTTHEDNRSHGSSARELIPREYLRVIAVWSLVPSYIVAGGFIGWILDRWLDTFPYLMGVCFLAALGLAVRDMIRLRDEFM